MHGSSWAPREVTVTSPSRSTDPATAWFHWFGSKEPLQSAGKEAVESFSDGMQEVVKTAADGMQEVVKTAADGMQEAVKTAVDGWVQSVK